MENKIFIGTLPGICGRGIFVIGASKEQVFTLMEKSYIKLKEKYGFANSLNTFEDAMNYLRGRIQEIEIGKVYDDNLNS